MVRFLIDKFRRAPGPLKQPRLIVADLAEEIIDLVGTYMDGKRSTADFEDAPAASSPAPRPASAPPEPPPAEEEDDDPAEPGPSLPDMDPGLLKAMKVPANQRKQEFKVLAILWDARQRDLEPLSAKAVSQHGKKIGLSIRHENVRKVIRMRLEKYIKVHAEGVGSGTIYRYQLAPGGSEYFTSTYFE
jgi:hypothetical protein